MKQSNAGKVLHKGEHNRFTCPSPQQRQVCHIPVMIWVLNKQREMYFLRECPAEQRWVRYGVRVWGGR